MQERADHQASAFFGHSRRGDYLVRWQRLEGLELQVFVSVCLYTHGADMPGAGANDFGDWQRETYLFAYAPAIDR